MADMYYGTPTTIFAGYVNSEGAVRKTDVVYIRKYPYVGEDGIYKPCQEYVPEDCDVAYQMIISKEMFVEAYNKWIKGVDCDDSK
jgi:hypothetical protein